MVARHVPLRILQGERYFRWRGGDVSRVESLSDTVFAIALTLIVVSLEVPRTYAELIQAFRELPVFAACFAFLIMCWHYNYRFHRRFGLEDFGTELLNAVLLFLILLYVYPLRFLFELLWSTLSGRALVVRGPDGAPLLVDGTRVPVIETAGQNAVLLALYSVGFAAIFAVFALMNARAWRLREPLDLDAVERQMTRATIGSHLMMVGVGLVSLVLVLIDRSLTPWAGMIFWLIGPLQFVFWFWQGRKVDRLSPADR